MSPIGKFNTEHSDWLI